MPAEVKTLQDTLRERLRAELGRCPTCKQSLPGGLRRLELAIGLSQGTAATLSRFLRGKNMSGDNLDKVWAYVNRRKPDAR